MRESESDSTIWCNQTGTIQSLDSSGAFIQELVFWIPNWNHLDSIWIPFGIWRFEGEPNKTCFCLLSLLAKAAFFLPSFAFYYLPNRLSSVPSCSSARLSITPRLNVRCSLHGIYFRMVSTLNHTPCTLSVQTLVPIAAPKVCRPALSRRMVCTREWLKKVSQKILLYFSFLMSCVFDEYSVLDNKPKRCWMLKRCGRWVNAFAIRIAIWMNLRPSRIPHQFI